MPKTQWTTFCRRTEDPKLAFIERRLDGMGIPHQRNGRSFHAPILQVPEERLEEAHKLLTERVTLTDGTSVMFDDVPDDHPMFVNGKHGHTNPVNGPHSARTCPKCKAIARKHHAR